MSKRFNELVTEALEVERELRVLAPGRASLRCFIAESLKMAGVTYRVVESVKERLESAAFERDSGTGVYLRHLTRELASGKYPEPPAADRIGRMGFNMKDQAVFEMGGQAPALLVLWVVAAERAGQQKPDAFGNIEDLGKHKARIAELETKRKDLYEKIASSWDNTDIWLGKITSDGAALVCFRHAPNDVTIHPHATAGARLIDWLLRQEREAVEAKAA